MSDVFSILQKYHSDKKLVTTEEKPGRFHHILNFKNGVYHFQLVLYVMVQVFQTSNVRQRACFGAISPRERRRFCQNCCNTGAPRGDFCKFNFFKTVCLFD